MKLIFLDVDGVLNTIQGEMYHGLMGQHANHRYPGKFDHQDRPHDFHQFLTLDWCPIAMTNLTYLVRSSPDVRIVVSSVWRYGYESDNMRWLFVNYPEIFNRTIGRTVSMKHGIRGLEIQEYLDRNPCKEFVIIDDESDMEHLLPHLVQTDSYVGLTYHHVQKALELLNIPDTDFSKVFHEIVRNK